HRRTSEAHHHDHHLHRGRTAPVARAEGDAHQLDLLERWSGHRHRQVFEFPAVRSHRRRAHAAAATGAAMTPRPRVFLATVLAMAAVGIGISGQTSAPSASHQEPTFRSGIKLIDLDVYVTDQDGHFVKDLTKDDFEIVEDGKPQDLQAFTFIDLPFETP